MSSLIGVPPAPHATAATTPCDASRIQALDIAAAAKVKAPNGKKRPKAIGMTVASAVAADLTSGTNTNYCNEPLSADDQSTYDQLSADYQSVLVGEVTREDFRESLRSTIESNAWVPTNRSAQKSSRASTTCEGFERHDVNVPASVKLDLELAQLAELAGDSDIAQIAYDSAVTSTEKWAESFADGAATSIPDLLAVLGDLQLLGGSEASEAKVRAKLDQAAKDAYDGYNKSRCRQSKSDLNCFFKAATLIALLGIEPASYYKDTMYQLENARDLARGKKLRCELERYAFRMRMTSDDTAGGKLEFDTGRVVFEVKDGKITSADSGPLVLSTNNNVKCWSKTDSGAWVVEGAANIKGGRFPYKVGGTDSGDVLHLILNQQGEWRVTGNGSVGCQVLEQLADMFLNAFPQSLRAPGMELPAGLTDYEGSETSTDVFEPTGETITSTLEFEYRMLYPKR